jgi:hypothetical protein
MSLFLSIMKKINVYIGLFTRTVFVFICIFTCGYSVFTEVTKILNGPPEDITVYNYLVVLFYIGLTVWSLCLLLPKKIRRRFNL